MLDGHPTIAAVAADVLHAWVGGGGLRHYREPRLTGPDRVRGPRRALVISTSDTHNNLESSCLLPLLGLTVPFVIYAVLRFLYLVFHRELGGQPEELFLTDRPLLLSVVLWGMVAMGVFLGQG